MIGFLIQTINGKIVHDFCFELERSLEYHEWRGNLFTVIYSEIDNLDKLKKEEYRKLVPIGTIEFVSKFLQNLYGNRIENYVNPLNVPINLFKFSSRNILNISLPEEYKSRKKIIDKCRNLFNRVYIKSNDYFKYNYNGIVKDINEIINFPTGNYQISSEIEIYSEYRCFIYHGNLVGIQYYKGDFTIFPDIETVLNIIKEFKPEYNNSYTIDVGVNDCGTFVIECHDFFSCGLYGFSDYNILPYMFIRSFNKIIENKIKGLH